MSTSKKSSQNKSKSNIDKAKSKIPPIKEKFDRYQYLRDSEISSDWDELKRMEYDPQTDTFS